MSNENEQVLAAALSAILGKDVLPEADVPQQTNRYVNKISLFDQHLTSFIYGKVGELDPNDGKSFLTLQIKILTTKTSFQCEIERDASVDKLKQIIYEHASIEPRKQNLIYCGQEIDEGHLLSEYGVEDQSEITVVRLRAMNADDILVLDKASLHPCYDYDFTNIKDESRSFTRGGVEYRRPCGWRRFAINVIGKYENEIWLASSDRIGEWPVSYHGTGKNAAGSIAQVGYDLTKCTRFAYGRGVYSTPDIKVAEAYAKSFILGGQEYLVVLQNRVNPITVQKVKPILHNKAEYWISPDAADIRPYGVCIKRKST